MRQAIETIDCGEYGGFDIRAEFYLEDSAIADSFDPSCWDIDQLVRDVESGESVWFIVRVVASKSDIELGDDWLGGCMYASFQEFVDIEDGYFGDMRDIAVDIAAAKLDQLAE